MSRATAGAAVLRAARNAPLSASVAWRHARRDPVGSLAVGLRALPARWRAAAARLAGRRSARRAGATAVLVLAAAGRREPALELLRGAAATASGRRLRHLVAAAAALHAPAQARAAADRLDPRDPARARLDALVTAEQGHLTEAVRLAADGGRATRGLHQRLAGELELLRRVPPPRTTTSPRRVTAPPPGDGPLRVVHLVTNALPEVVAGYTTRTQGIAAAQLAAGMQPHVVTRLGFPVTAGHLAAAAEIRVDGVAHHRLLPRRPLPTDPRRLARLELERTDAAVRRLRPAVLHAHSNHANGHLALSVARRHGLPVVYEVRGFLEETWRSRGNDVDSDTYRLARAAETAVMAAADAVVTLSAGMAADIVARGVDPARVSVVPNSVADRFLAPPPDPAALRRSLGIASQEVVVGTVSTLNDYEGVDVLVDAVARLCEDGAPVRLLVVGDGPAAAALRQRAAARTGRAAVFAGRVPFADVATYHAALDLFCVPRLDRPVCRMVTPLKPLEAMAVGRAVVASDLPPLREIVQPGRTGSLAPAGDPRALAEVLRPLLYDRDARTRMGRQARQWVAEHRTWAQVARASRDLYAGLGAAPGPSAPRGHQHQS